METAPSPRQIRGACAMLGWSMLDLARAAGLSVSTVKRAEGTAPEAVSAGTVKALRGSLEKAGARFLPDDGDGEGVRVKAR